VILIYICFLPLPMYVNVVAPCGIMIFLFCDLYKSWSVTCGPQSIELPLRDKKEKI
jgi:hypothetical protein